jgi:hypothetical protein
MRESGKKWKRSIAAGALGTLLLASVTLGAEARMQAERTGAKRTVAAANTTTARGRVVEFKPEGTDSFLCTYVSPFFCDYVPTVTSSAPTPGTAMAERGRR